MCDDSPMKNVSPWISGPYGEDRINASSCTLYSNVAVNDLPKASASKGRFGQAMYHIRASLLYIQSTAQPTGGRVISSGVGCRRERCGRGFQYDPVGRDSTTRGRVR